MLRSTNAREVFLACYAPQLFFILRLILRDTGFVELQINKETHT